MSDLTDEELLAELQRRGLAKATPPVPAPGRPPPPAPEVQAPATPTPAPQRPQPVAAATPNTASRPAVIGAVPSAPPRAEVGTPEPLAERSTAPIELDGDSPPLTGCPHCGQKDCAHERPVCEVFGLCDSRVQTRLGSRHLCAGHALIVWRSLDPAARDVWCQEVEAFLALRGVTVPADEDGDS